MLLPAKEFELYFANKGMMVFHCCPGSLLNQAYVENADFWARSSTGAGHGLVIFVQDIKHLYRFIERIQTVLGLFAILFADVTVRER